MTTTRYIVRKGSKDEPILSLVEEVDLRTATSAKDTVNGKQWVATTWGLLAFVVVIASAAYLSWGQPTYVVAPIVVGLIVVFTLLVLWLVAKANQGNGGPVVVQTASTATTATPLSDRRVQQQATSSVGINLKKLAALILIMIALGGSAYGVYKLMEWFTPELSQQVAVVPQRTTPPPPPKIEQTCSTTITVGKEWSEWRYVPNKYNMIWNREENVGFEVQPDSGPPIPYPRDITEGPHIPYTRAVRFRILPNDPAQSLRITLTCTPLAEAEVEEAWNAKAPRHWTGPFFN